MIELNKIYNENCLVTMQNMEDNSVDLIITSPPYNKNAYAVGSGSDKSWSALRGRQIPYDKYNDAMPPEEYEKWQKKNYTRACDEIGRSTKCATNSFVHICKLRLHR